MHRAEVGVLKQSHHIVLRASLQRLKGEASPAEALLELLLADLVDEPVEGGQRDHILGAVLETLDLHEDVGARRALAILEVLAEKEGVDAFALVLVAGPALERIGGALLAGLLEGRAFLHG